MGSATFVNDDEFLSAGWEATPWSVCAPPENETTALPVVPQGCTAGVQRRTVFCDPNGLRCQGPTPSTSRVCVSGALCGWAVGSWSACSESCGERGVQRRQAICISSLPGACPEYPHALNQECTGTLGCEWWRSPWGECTAACGAGVQHRSVSCQDSSGCSSLPPQRTQPCRGTSCVWYVGAWSACDGRSCGATGSQHREVRCEYQDGCLGQRPPSSQSCTLTAGCQFLSPASSEGRRIALATTTTPAPAPSATTDAFISAEVTTTTLVPEFTYFVGHWTACDTDCGFGRKTREVYCSRTCSIYRCPEVSDWWCQSVGSDRPTDILGCYGSPPPCPSAQPSSPATPQPTQRPPEPSPSSPPPTPSPSAAPSTTPSSGAVALSPGDVECVTAPSVVAFSSCLQAGPVLCGASCPCCRLKTVSRLPGPQLLPAPGANLVTVDAGSGESDSPSLGWTIAVVASSCVGTCFVLCVAYAAWHLHAARRAAHEVKQMSRYSKEGRRSSPPPRRSVPEAWTGREEYHDGEIPEAFRKQREDLGEPPDAFREPPEVDAERPVRHEGSGRIPRSRSEGFDRDRGAARDDAENRRSGKYSRAHSSKRREAASAAADAFAAAGEPDDDADDGPASPSSAPPGRSAGASEAAGGAARPSPGASSPSRPRAAATGPSSPPRGKRPADSEPDASAQKGGASLGPGGASGGAEPGASGAGGAGNESKSEKPKPDEGEAKRAVGSAVAPSPEVLGIIATIDKELDGTRGKDLEWRRRHFRELMLRWHPDKNRKESPEQAAEVFRHVMARRGGYLDA